ncbi:MAG: hypothetical protein ACTHON_18730 [Humibacter sp.]
MASTFQHIAVHGTRVIINTLNDDQVKGVVRANGDEGLAVWTDDSQLIFVPWTGIGTLVLTSVTS